MQLPPQTEPAPPPPGRRGLVIVGVVLLIAVVVVAGLIVGTRHASSSPQASQSDLASVAQIGGPGTWKALPSAPGPTNGFVLFADRWIIAGPAGSGGLNPWTVYVYDTTTGSWKTYAQGPKGQPPRTPFARVWDGTDMLVFGGFTKHTNVTYKTGVQKLRVGAYDTDNLSWEFNPRRGTWTQIPAMGVTAASAKGVNPQQRLGAVWTGQVVVVFGANNTHVKGHSTGITTMEFTPGKVPGKGTWVDYGSKSATKPQRLPGGSRIAPAYTWTGYQLVVWGGVSDVSAKSTNPAAALWDGNAKTLGDGYWYSTNTHLWQPIAAAPAGVSAVNPGASWNGTQWLFYGGTNITKGKVTQLPGGYLYVPSQNAWESLPASPIAALSGPVAAWTGNTLVVWGRAVGAGGKPGAPRGAVYDPVSGLWQRISSDSTVAGPGAAAEWVDGQLVVVQNAKVAAWTPTP